MFSSRFFATGTSAQQDEARDAESAILQSLAFRERPDLVLTP